MKRSEDYEEKHRMTRTFDYERTLGFSTNIVEKMIHWAILEETPLFLLLGQFGSGKTITCGLFTQRMLKEREQSPEQHIPLALYLDLRDISNIRQKYDAPLETLLVDMLSKPGECTPSGFSIFQYCQRNPTIVVYDSFDQACMGLTMDERMRFYKTIMGIIPNFSVFPKYGKDSKTRVVLPIRKESFRSEREQDSFLRMNGSMPQHRIEQYCMLPFNDEQIAEYILKNIGVQQKPTETGKDLLYEFLDRAGLRNV